jgi:hypothetical protein
MSIRVMSAAWELPMGAFEKLVLLALADCANDEGECWPSIATLKRKTGAGERTIQRAIRGLEAMGVVRRSEVFGKGNRYTVTPATAAPPPQRHPRHSGTPPPPDRHPTPATAAPKPSLNRKEPSKPKIALPANWHPVEFTLGTKCRGTVDGWPPGEIETQVEAFIACHTAKGSRFEDWQAAWKTWVLNWEKFGGKRGRQNQPDKLTTRQSGERVAASFAARGSCAVEHVPRLGAASRHDG